MNWAEIPWSPPSRTLRQFAVLWFGCFGGLASWHAFQNHLVSAAGWGALTLSVGFMGLFRPQAIRPVFVGSMVITFPLGWAISRLTLAVLYYGLFTPLGLWFRLTGRDQLGLRYCPEQTTYWQPKPTVHDTCRYYRPF
jgi:hypothetical protein